MKTNVLCNTLSVGRCAIASLLPVLLVRNDFLSVGSRKRKDANSSDTDSDVTVIYIGNVPKRLRNTDIHHKCCKQEMKRQPPGNGCTYKRGIPQTFQVFHDGALLLLRVKPWRKGLNQRSCSF